MQSFFYLFVFFCLSLQMYCTACCDFLIQSTDNTWVNGRSMEFAVPFDSSIVVHQRGERNISTAPNDQSGLKWESKYGFVTLIGMGLDSSVDGLNEKGLSMGFLWLPTSEYQKVPTGKNEQAINLIDLGTWVLGNFATVQEVREGLSKVFVWAEAIPQLKMIPPLHLSVHDSQGNSIVVEFIDGRKNIHENNVNVLTNFPTFDWQRINLLNYTNLRPINASPVGFKGQEYTLLGQGSGMLGLPGDWMPSSRFVRLFAIKEAAIPVQNKKDAVNLALHILNAMNIPLGAIRETDINKPNSMDYTQWIVVKDLSNKQFYFRTYENQNVYKLDLTKLDFSPGKSFKPLLLSIPADYIDITNQFNTK